MEKKEKMRTKLRKKGKKRDAGAELAPVRPVRSLPRVLGEASPRLPPLGLMPPAAMRSTSLSGLPQHPTASARSSPCYRAGPAGAELVVGPKQSLTAPAVVGGKGDRDEERDDRGRGKVTEKKERRRSRSALDESSRTREDNDAVLGPAHVNRLCASTDPSGRIDHEFPNVQSPVESGLGSAQHIALRIELHPQFLFLLIYLCT